MGNIKEFLDKIVEEVPNTSILIANIVSAEIRDQSIYLKFPLIRELKHTVEKTFYEVSKINSYSLNISFVKEYHEPFLPFTVLNSKYKNFVFYIIVKGKKFYSFIIQKNRLLSGNFKKDYLQNLVEDSCSEIKIENTISDSLITMYCNLKESWTYLHPVFFYNDESQNLKLDYIFNRVINRLEIKFNDIRRFVGQPFFTFYDLKNYIDKSLEKVHEN